MLGLFVPQLYGAETLVQQLQGKSACVFYLNPSRPILNNNLPTLHGHEVNGCKFPIVTTDVTTFYYLKKATFNDKRIFYIRHIGWHTDHYENQYEHFTDPNTIYVSNSEWVQSELKTCWGTTSTVIKEIEFERILDI